MTPMMWFVAAAIATAFLAFSVSSGFAADRVTSLTKRLLGSSRLVSRAGLVDGKHRLAIVLALTDASLIYEGARTQGTLARNSMKGVEYEREAGAGGGKTLRVRCV